MSTADPVAIFAALGDPTRLSLLRRLGDGVPRSIAVLTQERAISRQAVTKHLKVLEEAGLVRMRRAGREARWAAEREAIVAARDHLDAIAAQWDDALARLAAYVES